MSVTYRQNRRVAGRVIDGKAFIITPDDNRMHTLNATAAELWTRAKDGWTVAEAAAHLARRFQVDEKTAHGDVEACVQSLVARGILVTD